MTYIDYRHKVELSLEEYSDIDLYCKENKMNMECDYIERINNIYEVIT